MVLQQAKAYTNNPYGFSINPPQGWSTIDTTPSDGNSIPGIPPIIFYPVSTVNQTEVEINVNVSPAQETGFKSSSYTYDIYGLGIPFPGDLTNFQSSESGVENASYSGLHCLVFIYTSNYGQSDYKFKQIIFAENGKDYVLTFEALTNLYDSYEPLFERTLQTFRLASLGQTPVPEQNSSSQTSSNQPNYGLYIGMALGITIAVSASGFIIWRRKTDNVREQ